MTRTVLSSPGLAVIPKGMHVTAMLAERVAADPLRAFAEVKDEHGGWTMVTLIEFNTSVRAVAKGLIAAGVQVGDRVGIVGETRIEWSIMDFAIFAAGAVTVPIYPSSSESQFAWILADAGIAIV
ncbi:MAG: long-chain fatty acid--CoA ligase, partial [Demequinaceae bacterium]|nr:long-chain fatty acid--CoA ligase [Demequinaceae bacterium]